MITLVIKLPTDLQDTRERIQQVLEALHSVIPGKQFSLCANVMSRKLFFSIECEETEQHIIENQIYSEFDHIEIDKVKSPLSFPESQSATAVIRLKEKDFFRIPTYKDQTSSLFAKLLTQTASLDTVDQFAYTIDVMPFNTHNAIWQMKRRLSYKWYRFFKVFDLKSKFLDTKINTKSKEALASYEEKNRSDLYKISMSISVRSTDQNLAKAKVIGLARNLLDIQDQKNMIEFDVQLG